MQINKAAEANVYQSALTPKTVESESAAKARTSLAAENTDKFVRSEISYAPAYTKHVQDKDEQTGRISKQQAFADANREVEEYTNFIRSLLGQQRKASEKKDAAPELSLDELLGEPSQLEDLDGSGDLFSVENVAQNIVAFAKSLAGDDPSKLQTLKDAFDKGFAQAEGIFGGEGKLPEISYKTRARVYELFDAWEKSYETAPDESPTPDTVKASSVE